MEIKMNTKSAFFYYFTKKELQYNLGSNKFLYFPTSLSEENFQRRNLANTEKAMKKMSFFRLFKKEY